ncbi:SDR family NAD(P)-dependent oxidoreductase [Lactobacillus selangorensis]|nr:SDR family NAD(P)-dependent oxidoreductase [Lactobacillus selangorensis]
MSAHNSKTAVVTGGGTQIAHDQTKALVAQGLNVILLGQEPLQLMAVREELGTQVIPYQIDTATTFDEPLWHHFIQKRVPSVSLMLFNLDTPQEDSLDADFEAVINATAKNPYFILMNAVKQLTPNSQIVTVTLPKFKIDKMPFYRGALAAQQQLFQSIGAFIQYTPKQEHQPADWLKMAKGEEVPEWLRIDSNDR